MSLTGESTREFQESISDPRIADLDRALSRSARATLGDLFVLSLQDNMYELVWVLDRKAKGNCRAVSRVLDYIRRRLRANHGAQRIGDARHLDVRAR